MAAPADVWPVLPPVAPNPAALATTAAGMPPELAPAVRFQETFLRILSRAPVGDWLPQIRGFAQAAGTDAVTATVREVSLAWVARVEMEDIRTALENYYVQNVRFPAAFSEVERDLPKDRRVDPWGEPWIYRPHAPMGFARETGQRYQLGPTRYPDLGYLRAATVERHPLAPPAWKIFPRAAGGSPALEFHVGATVVGLIQPGGRIDAWRLLYIGEHWALMAGADQLFTVAF